MFKLYLSLIKVFFHFKKSFILIGFLIFSLGLSLSVVLTSVGIMNGFEKSLKEALILTDGHFVLIPRDAGYFDGFEKMKSHWPKSIDWLNPSFETSGFIFFPQVQDASQGVWISAVNYRMQENKKIPLAIDDIYLGSSFQKRYSLKIGQDVSLILGSPQFEEDAYQAPRIINFKIKGFFEQKVHDYNGRKVIISYQKYAREVLGENEQSNKTVWNKIIGKFKSFDDYDAKLSELKTSFVEGFEAIVNKSWKEYEYLLEAVKIEKISLGVILQLIILISLFNIMAALVYISEKKVKDLFMLNALGISRWQLRKTWLLFVGILFPFAMMISLVLCSIYDWCFRNLSFLQLPGKIYHISRLTIQLNLNEQIIIFLAAFIWLMLMANYTIGRVLKRSLIEGLKSEWR